MPTEYPPLAMLIDGERYPGAGKDAIAVINPATGSTLAALPMAEAGDLDAGLPAGVMAIVLGRPAATSRESASRNGVAPIP